jgi:hypothetical protein
MKTVDWTEATPWEEVIKQGECEEIVVMRDGHAVALLTPFDDDDLHWYAREHDPAFLASIEAARQQVRQGKTVGHHDLVRELGLDQDPEWHRLGLDPADQSASELGPESAYGTEPGPEGGCEDS